MSTQRGKKQPAEFCRLRNKQSAKPYIVYRALMFSGVEALAGLHRMVKIRLKPRLGCKFVRVRLLGAYPKNRTSGIPMPLIPTHRDASAAFFG